jgi:hypothetical protein
VDDLDVVERQRAHCDELALDRRRGAPPPASPPGGSMKVSLVPSWRHAAAHSLRLIAAVIGVAGAMYVANGAPSATRRVRQNEIARFSPTLVHGVVQLVGETGLVVLAAWIARRGLKVRL